MPVPEIHSVSIVLASLTTNRLLVFTATTLASLVELPLIGPPRQRIAQINAGMVLKAVWMVRTTVPLQIARCRYCDDLQVGQLAHDQG